MGTEEFSSVPLDFATTSMILANAKEVDVSTIQRTEIQSVIAQSANTLSQTVRKMIVCHFLLKVIKATSVIGQWCTGITNVNDFLLTFNNQVLVLTSKCCPSAREVDCFAVQLNVSPMSAAAPQSMDELSSWYQSSKEIVSLLDPLDFV